MNNKLKILATALMTLAMISCAENESPFIEGGSSSNNIVSAKNFALSFDDLSPDVYDVANDITFTSIPVVITVNAGDRFQAKVTGGTVFFRTEVGLLDSSSCELVNGTCSVNWVSAIEPNARPADNINTVTAWMTGEEGFTDLNGSGIFDDGDIFTHDLSDPFLDLSHDGLTPTYNAGVDALIIDTAFDAADSAYSGTGCAHSTLCATTSSTFLFDTQEMDLAF
ncbi:MAG: hypothetical protein DIZ80_16450 [endosymbiont of Galathealinum brachiosum]|uniref:Uncharacterized protein n=1 Tax=endosymbiont of Galathealinum brachiosum TaxID=2200906 RepID=A0A370DBI6_9GAMM|nr:MAG: hypothetical protein DIZ80_16450 [endosymbiont of Galathealinum brachiosum]